MTTLALAGRNMEHVEIDARQGISVGRRRVEIVERKGLGHPDTICDALVESISVALSAEYRRSTGRILHHNLDKSLLIAGQTAPTPGGGSVAAPMRLVVGDRATGQWEGKRFPIAEIVEETTERWFRENLRFVDPHRHLILQNEIRPGSPELVDIFSRRQITANDTSAAVGHAPLTETERLVLAAERFLNSQEYKSRRPETGEDVKVMAVRRGRALNLTLAVAFVDRFVPDGTSYFQMKAEVERELRAFLEPQLVELDDLALEINTLDDPDRGAGGMYLTVLGTAAEGADGGEVGRGNRVNGIISLMRPMTTEAAAGKNPVSHVGKIYNVLSHEIARRIHASVGGVEEVTVWMCSQIGRPLDDPWSVAVELILAPDASLSDVEVPIQVVVHDELQQMDRFVERLSRGAFAVC